MLSAGCRVVERYAVADWINIAIVARISIIAGTYAIISAGAVSVAYGRTILIYSVALRQRECNSAIDPGVSRITITCIIRLAGSVAQAIPRTLSAGG